MASSLCSSTAPADSHYIRSTDAVTMIPIHTQAQP